MKEINEFKNRLNKIGIDLELSANFPWIYIEKINGKNVVEQFRSNYGFTLAFIPARKDEKISFTDIGEIFHLIRKYI